MVRLKKSGSIFQRKWWKKTKTIFFENELLFLFSRRKYDQKSSEMNATERDMNPQKNQLLTPNSRGDILILWLVENPHILAKITKNHPILPEISKNIKFFHHYCCWQFWKVVKRDIQKYIGSQKLPGNERIRTRSDRSSIFRF